MALGNPIQIRLNTEKQAFYESEAARLGVPFAAYLRDRIEASVEAESRTGGMLADVASSIATLRAVVEGGTKKQAGAVPGAKNQSPDDALLLEILLLLRAMAAPEKVKFAQAEVNRQGLKPWTPKGDK